MEDDKLVMFDSNGSIRIYEPERFDEMVKTVTCQKDFVTKMDEFKSVVEQTMKIVEQLGQAIDKEKLRAIGSRNIVESESEARKRAMREAEFRHSEKQRELDRHLAEYNALLKVEQEQRSYIQKLSLSARD
eukprot:GILI01010434.1.p1 GENE.GILI01010434.1~~GILI01010434.1.p1  ORF type:complete len:131 (-),score=29.97 GILI01010434.1:103-495(-)